MLEIGLWKLVSRAINATCFGNLDFLIAQFLRETEYVKIPSSRVREIILLDREDPRDDLVNISCTTELISKILSTPAAGR